MGRALRNIQRALGKGGRWEREGAETYLVVAEKYFASTENGRAVRNTWRAMRMGGGELERSGCWKGAGAGSGIRLQALVGGEGWALRNTQQALRYT